MAYGNVTPRQHQPPSTRELLAQSDRDSSANRQRRRKRQNNTVEVMTIGEGEGRQVVTVSTTTEPTDHGRPGASVEGRPCRQRAGRQSTVVETVSRIDRSTLVLHTFDGDHLADGRHVQGALIF